MLESFFLVETSSAFFLAHMRWSASSSFVPGTTLGILFSSRNSSGQSGFLKTCHPEAKLYWTS